MNKTQKAFGVLAATAVALTAVSAQTTTNTTAAKVTTKAPAVTVAKSTTTTDANGCTTFGANLKLGMRGDDVVKLQQILNSNPATAVAASGVGSKGMETNYFGPATMKAVIKFQELNAATALTPAGLKKGTGLVGSLTRAALATVCGKTATTNANTGSTTVVSTTNTTLAGQPTGYVILGQAAARLAEVTVSGNGTLTNLTLQRAGASSNDVLANVYLYDGINRISDSASVNNNGVITFNNLSVSVVGSKNLTVKADMTASANCTNCTGQAIKINLTSATINNVVVPQSFEGPTLSVAAISTATVSATSNNNTATANTNLNVPQMNYTVWGSTISVSTRPVVLKSFAIKMIGSAPSNAVTNVNLFVDGTKVATASPDSQGRYTFTPNNTMNTGSHNIEVRADVVGGASRNFYFMVENIADIVAEDSSLPGVASSLGNFANVKQGGTMTINSAGSTSINFVTDPTFTTTNVISGASNVTIGKYNVTAYGEDTKIQYLSLGVDASSAQNLTNVALFVNGAQVGSNYTIATGTVAQQYSLGSSFVATAGVTYSVEVRADLTSSTGVKATGTVKADIISLSGQGMYSQNTVTLSPINETVRSLTVGGGDPQVGKTVNGVSANAAANSSNIKIGSFSIQGGSIEDITVKTLVLGLTTTDSLTNISAVTLKDENGNTIGTPAGIASASQNYSVNMVVAKGATKRVDVFANLGSMTNTKTITPELTVTYLGNSSNQQVSPAKVPGDTITIQSIAVGTPTISSKIASKYVLGSSNQQVVVYNATSQYGSATINDMTFTVTGSGVQSIVVNGITANVIGSTAIAYGLNINVPAGSAGVNIPVTVNYTPAYAGTTGSSNGVQSGVTATVSWTGAKITDASGAVTTPTLTLAANPMTLVASVPTVNAVANSGSSIGAGAVVTNQKIGSITVAADKSGDIVVGQIAYSASGPKTITIDATEGSVKVNGSLAQDKTGANVDLTTAGVIKFTNGYRITSGTSVTFDIYGKADNNGATIPVTTSVTLGAEANFKWSDDASTKGNEASAYTAELLGSNYNK